MLVQSVWAVDVALGILWKWAWVITRNIVIWCGVVHVSIDDVRISVHQTHISCRCVEWSSQICDVEGVVVVSIPSNDCISIPVIRCNIPGLSKCRVIEIVVIIVLIDSCDSSHIIIISHVLIPWNN